MKLDLCLKRKAPLGGTNVVSVDIGYKRASELERMGTKLTDDRYAFGYNDQGFVIQFAKVRFTLEDHNDGTVSDPQKQINKAKDFFGIAK